MNMNIQSYVLVVIKFALMNEWIDADERDGCESRSRPETMK